MTVPPRIRTIVTVAAAAMGATVASLYAARAVGHLWTIQVRIQVPVSLSSCPPRLRGTREAMKGAPRARPVKK
ncbi:MAG TPA: hypothetical protein VD833_01405 [Vicinamibacterales bacterium]|nr:hypothetical protein [Vicinamibacterales bacterium]